VIIISLRPCSARSPRAGGIRTRAVKDNGENEWGGREASEGFNPHCFGIPRMMILCNQVVIECGGLLTYMVGRPQDENDKNLKIKIKIKIRECQIIVRGRYKPETKSIEAAQTLVLVRQRYLACL
jgi:hypothetical protein